MEIQAAYYSSIGGRKKNEDSLSLLECTQGVIAVMADGLGGLTGGEIASRMAVQKINACLLGRQVSQTTLADAIAQANQEIYEKNRSEMSRMLTTAAVLWMKDNVACAANVGDSRIYQFRNRGIIFQTQDHSVAGMAYLLGEIPYDEIRRHEDRNKLVRAVGGTASVKADLSILEVRPGDAFLLCSDGFWEYIYEEEILGCLNLDIPVTNRMNRMRRIISDRFPHDSDNNSCIIIEVL